MTHIVAAGTSVGEVKSQLENVTSSFFNLHAMVSLLIFLAVAFILGRIMASLLRRLVVTIGRQADKTDNLQTVNRIRRYETIIILSIAIMRTFFILFALYSWWLYIHPHQQPTAIIGASALFAIILGATLSPALRDIASGSVMMAEQWYAVGDYVRIEPFGDMQGVVERVTLRSTRIRGLNGEVIWVNNQNIQAVRITPKGIRTLAIELFVRNLDLGQKLIDSANRRLPGGPLLVISPLNVMTSTQVGDELWHITAIAETAPGREWLIERYAIDVLKEIDSTYKTAVLATEPVARYADNDAERRFARAIQNARKGPKVKRGRRQKTPSQSES
jgi:hypothetical protein